MQSTQSLYTFIISLFTAMIMVPYLQRWAIDTDAVDISDERKVHKRAVPRLGGVAICMTWLFSLLVYVDMTREVRGILAGSLIIFFTGFIDDLYGLTPKKKFLGQIIASLVTVTAGHITIHSLGDLFGIGTLAVPELLAVPFTILAVVGIVNAFNLMDGLDGLAGGISTIALTALLILGYLSDNFLLIALCAALLGGVLGFLKYNVHPARMGDTGSLLVGFVIAFLAILLTQSPGTPVQPLLPFLILGLPIVDTMRVMGSRMLQRKSPFSPDKTHVHHRFLDLGLDHRRTVTIIYGISLLLAGFAVFCRDWSGPNLLLTFAATMTGFYTLIAVLRRQSDTVQAAGKLSLKYLRNAPPVSASFPDSTTHRATGHHSGPDLFPAGSDPLYHPQQRQCHHGASGRNSPGGQSGAAIFHPGHQESLPHGNARHIGAADNLCPESEPRHRAQLEPARPQPERHNPPQPAGTGGAPSPLP
jgi:UDP-GlcNAc:undecaprenyl-phosphate GlcNAc-1-phosphate transferase